MRHWLFALPLFLISSPVSAFLTGYSWTGSVDWGDTRGQQTATGLIETDGTMVSRVTLDIGSFRYVHIPQFHTVNNAGPLLLTDCALVSEDLNSGGDFQFDEERSIWSFQWREGSEDSLKETGGTIVRFLGGDTNPTPEPASFVLMGSALAGLGGFRLFGFQRAMRRRIRDTVKQTA